MVIIINRITRAGDIGEPGYSAYGEELPCERKSGRHDSWHGATQDKLSDLLPSCLITKSVLDFLTPSELNSVRTRIQGVVDNSYVKSERVCGYFGCAIRHTLSSKIYPLPAADPCEGITCKPKCVGVDRYETVCDGGVCVRGKLIEANSEQCGFVCTEGTKRSKETCWDGSTIYKEICRGNKWVSTGETCPPMPTHGAKRNPTTCWDGSVIHAEKFDVTLKRWIPTGEICPTKPECIPGDKKAGYVCKNGKWQAVPEPTVPEPVVEPPTSEPENGGTCYINFDIPLLDMLPGLPCKWWLLPIPPGFKKTNKK
ncbi:MAG: hypothetical protein J7K40_15430 [candidate division Zixibacteria bacterium]|nr:hypothetical protein [candidate division Zixibacteria bacterium]